MVLLIAAPIEALGYTPRDSLTVTYPLYSDIEIDRTKLAIVGGLHVAGFTGAILYLNQAWYANYPRSSFHFHNDLKDWLQMDKMGHVVSTYQISRFSSAAFGMSGVNRKTSALLGAGTGLLFITAIEVLDGFSTEWGFSASDMAANIIGAGSYATQEVWLKKRIFDWKYSFHESDLHSYRPDLLGYTTFENMIKDYNGISYWLSLNMKTAWQLHPDFPSWLNLAFGYSATGMLGGRENPGFYNGVELPNPERYRRWFLAPDIDLSRIPIRNAFFHKMFSALNVIKFPTPALEYNRVYGWSFHLLYF
jgi:hypothetical protein